MKNILAVFLGLALAAMGCGDDAGAGTGGTGGVGGAGGGAGGVGGTGGIEPVCGDPDAPATSSLRYDLTTGIFRPYNLQFDVMTGSGDVTSDCAVPDLSGNPGANADVIITNRCQILPVGGCMQFFETSNGIFQVVGENSFFFVTTIVFPSVSAEVRITADFVMEYSGTATGEFPGDIQFGNPGMITMDDLGGGFNMNAVAIGTANCEATNTITGNDVTEEVCRFPFVNLMPGDNPLPFPMDPGMRTFPPFILGLDRTLQLAGEVVDGSPGMVVGGGATDPEGWYLLNPAPMVGNGNQWVSLAGNCTNCDQ